MLHARGILATSVAQINPAAKTFGANEIDTGDEQRRKAQNKINIHVRMKTTQDKHTAKRWRATEESQKERITFKSPREGSQARGAGEKERG